MVRSSNVRRTSSQGKSTLAPIGGQETLVNGYRQLLKGNVEQARPKDNVFDILYCGFPKAKNFSGKSRRNTLGEVSD